MESSELTSQDMEKIQIISNNLRKMDEKRMESFKKALCQLKPRRGAGRIKMRDIKNKSIEQMVVFVFRYHTEKRAVSTIKLALEKNNDNQIKKFIVRDIGIANKIKKNMETGINKGNKSNKNGQAEKNEEQPQVSTTQGKITNIMLLVPRQHFGIVSSHTSSKEPPQVNQRQSNVKANTFRKSSDQLYGGASSKEQSHVCPKPGNNEKKKLAKASNEKFGVAPSKSSSITNKINKHMETGVNEEQPQVDVTQCNFTSSMLPRAPNQQFGIVLPHTSSKEQPQVSTTQGKTTNIVLIIPPQFGIVSSHTSSKEEPQVNPTPGNVTNTLSSAPNKQAPFHASSKKPTQVNQKQSNVTANTFRKSSDQLYGGASSKEQSHVCPKPGNNEKKKLAKASNEKSGVAPCKSSSITKSTRKQNVNNQ